MKILFCNFLVLLIFASFLQAANNWVWVNPLPQGNDLTALQAIDSNYIVAIGSRSTFLKSMNGGLTWSVRQFIGGTDGGVTAIHFSDPNTGTVVGPGLLGGTGIILRTTDGGETWSNQNPGLTGHFTGVHFTDVNNGIVVGAAGKILRTTDGGSTWTSQHRDSTEDYEATDFTNSRNGTIVGYDYTHMISIVLRTTDGGVSWNLRNSGIVHAIYGVSFVDSATGTVMGGAGYLYRTTDAGYTWTPQTIMNVPLMAGISFTDANHGVAVGNGHVGNFLRERIYRTTDGGTTWIIADSNATRGLNGVSFSDAAHGIAVGVYGAIMRTTDGGITWFLQSSGSLDDLWGVSFSTVKNGVVVGGGGIHLTTDGGTSWSIKWEGILYYSGVGAVSFSDSTNGTAVGNSGSNGLILRTTDAGNTWNEQNPGASGDLIAVHFVDSLTGWAAGGTVIHTTDGGATWNPQTLPVAQYFDGVYFIDRNRGYVVGGGADSGYIQRTTDGGATWSSMYIGDFFHKVTWIRGIAFADTNHGIAVGIALSRPFTGANHGAIYRTADGGKNWSLQYFSPDPMNLNAVAMVDAKTAVAVGTAALKTTDGGVTWVTMKNPTQNELMSVSIGSSGLRRIGYASGFGGSLLCTGLPPLFPKSWTGAVDSSWNLDSNWTPLGVPTSTDSVIIPVTATNPVIFKLQQQIVIGSLNILSGARLTVTDSLARFVIKGDVTLKGTLEIRPPAAPSIVVGGNWFTQPSGAQSLKNMLVADNGFVPSRSTVYFTGSGVFSENFYNCVFDTLSSMQSAGNVYVQSQCSVLKQVNLRRQDTLFIDNNDPQSLVGDGVVFRGTVKRVIRTGNINPYSFESSGSFIQFQGAGTNPAAISITSYPDTNLTGMSGAFLLVPSRADTVKHTVTADSVSGFSRWAFAIPRPHTQEEKGENHEGVSGTKMTAGSFSVKRLYAIAADGGTGFTARLSLHYDPSEILLGVPEDSLKLFRVHGVTLPSSFAAGWNMVSLPLQVDDGRSTLLFTQATSKAFAYAGMYVAKDTLVPGSGYWLKFNSVQSVGVSGDSIYQDTIPVATGWNMIGSITSPVSKNSISSIPGGLVTTQFYGYNGSYYAADTIKPGRGYWVKVNQTGSLLLSSGHAAGASGLIKIVPTSELPPSPPDDIVSSESRLPKEYALNQSYPNPANPQATIKYQLPADSRVTLKLYNLLGQVVGALIDEVQSAGYKSVVWNGNAMASGVYFYRLDAVSVTDQSKTFSDVKKILLVK